ncbi:MAG: hypothetical protein Q7U04_01130 [Bacteriovorax sp.]|nr:hypothetical protein [Bacteriovorax sp.]
MKSLLILIALSTISLAAVAGPEDTRNQSCFTATTKVPSSLPQVYCLDSVLLTAKNTILGTYGTYSNTPATLTVKSITAVGLNSIKFVAEAKILDGWDAGCYQGEVAFLRISGITEMGESTEVSAKDLSLSVAYTSTNDTCHSEPIEETFVYSLIK